MKASLSVKHWWKPTLLESKTRKAEEKWIKRAAAVVRLTAKRSIRKRSKKRKKGVGRSSPAGQPPTTGDSQYLRNAMAFQVDSGGLSAVIGVLGGGEFAGKLDGGGDFEFQEFVNKEAFEKGRSDDSFWMDGIPRNTSKWVAIGNRRTVKFAPRPFLMPAVVKTAKNITDLWAGAIQ